MITRSVEILKNIGWVLLAVSIAFSIIIPFVVIAAISSFSFGEIPASTKVFVLFLIIVGTSAGPFIGGYTTARNVTNNTTHWVLLTSFSITGIIVLNIDFNTNHYDVEEIISIPLAIIFTFFGGYYGLKKKKFINSFSSQSDNP